MNPLERWRLILGDDADPARSVPLEGDLAGMDQVLEQLYNPDRRGGLGNSSPKVNRWLGDIRKYFPTPVVQVLQRDALERLGLKRLLLEPELLASVEPDVHLVGALLSLNKILPTETRETARQVVRQVVKNLEKRLRLPLERAVHTALQRSQRKRKPRLSEIDWRRTLHANLRHYQPELKALVPEKIIGFGRKGRSLKEVILLVDQSGSMAGSVVYSGLFASVLASIRALQTHLVVFDTAVADLTDKLHDPVDVLFGTQLGGGTDIDKALGYAQTLVRRPADTILVLISDLFEGGHRSGMAQKIQALQSAGVRIVVLLALDDEGTPSFDRDMAAQLASMGLPAFGCTPDQFPDIMAEALRK